MDRCEGYLHSHICHLICHRAESLQHSDTSIPTSMVLGIGVQRNDCLTMAWWRLLYATEKGSYNTTQVLQQFLTHPHNIAPLVTPL